jgi:hypothetical protein
MAAVAFIKRISASWLKKFWQKENSDIITGASLLAISNYI